MPISILSRMGEKSGNSAWKTQWTTTVGDMMDDTFAYDDQQPVCSIPDAPILNLSDPSIATRYEYNSVQSALVTIIYPCICLFGILTNSIFLLTVIRVPHMKNITNIYLSSLAVSDIMFLITGTGFGLWRYLSTPVISDFSFLGGVHGCLITQVLNSTPFYASTLLVTVVAVERYLAICRPIHHRKINSRGRAFALIAVTWVVALCCEAMLCPTVSDYTVKCVIWPNDDYFMEFPQTIGGCFYPALWAQILTAFALIVPSLLAIFVTFILYILIVRKLSKRIHKAPSEQTSNRAKSRRTRDHVAKMLITAGTVFYILLTPRTVVTIYYYIKSFAGTPGLPPGVEFILFTSTNILLYVNSVTNPIMYAFSNKRYRTAFIQAFCPGSKMINVSSSS
ncbi:neuromedin-U receptor 2-like [Patiria miniata]|uniref:G-protein coupled receptors family 1 profile domain-containing protein n=1 Tax=Patiria miniata TaxID=46514 RepID=A0A913ZLS0_PATMI|nr:neuromedin-U receptor 2-like [Patiria miniata]